MSYYKLYGLPSSERLTESEGPSSLYPGPAIPNLQINNKGRIQTANKYNYGHDIKGIYANIFSYFVSFCQQIQLRARYKRYIC